MTDSVVEVYRARNGLQAHLFVAALERAGIKAEIQGEMFNPAVATSSSLISVGNVWWDSPRICTFAKDADRARQLLLELESRELEKARAVDTGPPIDVVCEECGNRALFPAVQRGSVQQCSKCGTYLDVGDDEIEDGWGEDDAGA